jgi:hypothetical protein
MAYAASANIVVLALNDALMALVQIAKRQPKAK